MTVVTIFFKPNKVGWLDFCKGKEDSNQNVTK